MTCHERANSLYALVLMDDSIAPAPSKTKGCSRQPFAQGITDQAFPVRRMPPDKLPQVNGTFGIRPDDEINQSQIPLDNMRTGLAQGHIKEYPDERW